MLQKEFDYYLQNQEELVKLYKDRYIVIKEQKVIGNYPTEMEAYLQTTKLHAPGTFLIQLCTPGKDAFTQTFHSRVTFAQVGGHMNTQIEGGISCLDLPQGATIKINGVTLSPGILEKLQTIQSWDAPRAMARAMTDHVYALSVHRSQIEASEEPVPGPVSEFCIPPEVFTYTQQFTDLLDEMQEVSMFAKEGRRP